MELFQHQNNIFFLSSKFKLIDLNFLRTNSLNSSIFFISIVNPAAILCPPPATNNPAWTAPIITDPISNPYIDLADPLPRSDMTEIIIVGLLNFSLRIYLMNFQYPCQ